MTSRLQHGHVASSYTTPNREYDNPIATSRAVWSARQSDPPHAIRSTDFLRAARRLLPNRAGSVIQGYDEAAWAECPQLATVTCPWCTSLRSSRRATRVTGRARTESRGRPPSVTANTPNPVATRSRRARGLHPNIRNGARRTTLRSRETPKSVRATLARTCALRRRCRAARPSIFTSWASNS